MFIQVVRKATMETMATKLHQQAAWLSLLRMELSRLQDEKSILQKRLKGAPNVPVDRQGMR